MKKGFTLIELLAAIAILAIVAIFAAAKINDIISSSKVASRKEGISLYANEISKMYLKDLMNDTPSTFTSAETGGITYGDFINFSNDWISSNPELDDKINCLSTDTSGLSKVTYNKVTNLVNILNCTVSDDYYYSYVNGNAYRTDTLMEDENAFNITYDLAGGSVSPSNPPKYSPATTTFTLNNPTKPAYMFSGWSGTDITGNSVTVSITKGATGDRSYTAHYTPLDYTIVYNLDSGTATNPSSYNIETITFTINNPTKTNYTFDGWSDTALGSDRITNRVITQGSTGNKTYYAHYHHNPSTITFDNQGATSAGTTTIQATYGSAMPSITLPAKTGYIFMGYYSAVSGGGTKYYDDEGASAKNYDLSIDITLYAYWIVAETDYDYTGNIQNFTVPKTGYYKLEAWGAQGGYTTGGANGGTISTITPAYGGYSKGIVYLEKGVSLYIVVGGAGQSNCISPTNGTCVTCTGGYNGGGGGVTCDAFEYVSGGGGATHISKVTGLLSTLSSNISDILIVAGGGGGGAYYNYSSAGSKGYGGFGGGFTGVSGSLNGGNLVLGGNPVTGNAFGQGAIGSNRGGGGGGFYGGFAGSTTSTGGGGGSGYIANTLLLEKYMYCYNCSTSSGYSTFTYSTTNVSATPLADTTKSNNGYSKITYLGGTVSYTQITTGYKEIYAFAGAEQKFIAPLTGTYKIDVWGAQGGYTTGGANGGTISTITPAYGGYSTGKVSLTKDQIVYIYVGRAGQSNCVSPSNGTCVTCTGGYNGGGDGVTCDAFEYVSGGGGATHISKVTGLLPTLSSNISDILIVAGGGGGGAYYNYSWAGSKGYGGFGGGFTGVSGSLNGGTLVAGGTQTTGNAFGQGAIGSNRGGGGGGFYGGLAGSTTSTGGGGGSGYITNSLLTDKYMYCYSCTTSSDASTLTYSTTNVSTSPISNYAKVDDGYAIITLLTISG